jgi:hypothetical protein
VTRLEAAREAAGRTRDTLAPYAFTAKDTAAHCAEEARHRLAPHVEALAPRVEAATCQARHAALSSYAQHLAPRMGQIRTGIPPQVEEAALRVAQRTRDTAVTAGDAAFAAALQARATAAPKVAHAVGEARGMAAPVAHEAQARTAAALAALRSGVTAAEIERLSRRHRTAQKCGRWTRRLAMVGLLSGSAAAVLLWWRRQNNPEWLSEPPADEDPTRTTPSDTVPTVPPTGIAAAETVTRDNTLDGSPPLDPELQTKQEANGQEGRKDS